MLANTRSLPDCGLSFHNSRGPARYPPSAQSRTRVTTVESGKARVYICWRNVGNEEWCSRWAKSTGKEICAEYVCSAFLVDHLVAASYRMCGLKRSKTGMPTTSGTPVSSPRQSLLSGAQVMYSTHDAVLTFTKQGTEEVEEECNAHSR